MSMTYHHAAKSTNNSRDYIIKMQPHRRTAMLNQQVASMRSSI